MNTQAQVQPKARSDDTRARIIEMAEALFRRLGFAKTAVADIAAELGMSPANVYRFFSSKNAIVEAICQRCLSELDSKAWEVARSRAPAAERMARLFVEIFNTKGKLDHRKAGARHRAGRNGEQSGRDREHTEVIRNVIEVILRDGIEAESSSRWIRAKRRC